MDHKGIKCNNSAIANLRRPEDRRVIRTRRLLRASLLALLRRKSYEEIKVQELIDEAGVGRSTFYCYCNGKEDLLRQSFKMMRLELREVQYQAQKNLPEGDATLKFALPLIAHADSHRDLYSSLRGRGRTILTSELRSLVSEFAQEELSRRSIEAKVPCVALQQFVVGAFMAIFSWWLENRVACTPPELDRMFQHLVVHGIGAPSVA